MSVVHVLVLIKQLTKRITQHHASPQTKKYSRLSFRSCLIKLFDIVSQKLLLAIV